MLAGVAVVLVVVLAAAVAWALKTPGVNAAAGAWAATGGLFSRSSSGLLAPTGEAPHPPRPLALSDNYFPTYLPGPSTPRDMAAALACATGPVTVEHVRAVCKALRVRAELRDVAGQVVVVVDIRGDVRGVG